METLDIRRWLKNTRTTARLTFDAFIFFIQEHACGTCLYTYSVFNSVPFSTCHTFMRVGTVEALWTTLGAMRGWAILVVMIWTLFNTTRAVSKLDSTPSGSRTFDT